MLSKPLSWALTWNVNEPVFDNIDYSLAAVLMTRGGIAFTFAHSGSVEGTIAGLPFGTPRRDDHATIAGGNPTLQDEFGSLEGATFIAVLDGTDTLVAGIKGLIDDAIKAAAKEIGAAAAKAVIALVV